MTEETEIDHFPEVALGGGSYSLAERIGFEEQELNSAPERRKALRDIEPDVLLGSIVQLNAVLRGMDSEEGKIEDGHLPMETTPGLEDKESLMLEAITAAQSILSDESLKDKYALRRAGLTIAGGLNLVHPFMNGNGRTARLLHYFIEFGEERGKDLFEAEAYSALGKIAVYDVDFRKSVDTTPPGKLGRTLNIFCEENYSKDWQDANPEERAAIRARTFIRAMKGEITVNTHTKASISHIQPGKFALLPSQKPKDRSEEVISSVIAQPGMDITELYERQYEAMSFAANIAPDQIPDEAKKVIAHKSPPRPTTSITIDVI